MILNFDINRPDHPFHYKDHSIRIYSDGSLTPEARKTWFGLFRHLKRHGVDILNSIFHEGPWRIHVEMNSNTNEIIISYELMSEEDMDDGD